MMLTIDDETASGRDALFELWSAGRGLNSKLFVRKATPKMTITDELLNLLRSGRGHPDVTIDGDVITINATNGRWVYRVTEYDPKWRMWRAEWPD